MTAHIVVLISGKGSNLQAIIDACNNDHIAGEVVAVVADNEAAYGLVRAREAGIATHVLPAATFSSRADYDQALQTIIDDYTPDVVALAGFMRILSAPFVHHYRGKLLNIHPSLLPKYSGLHTHQRVLTAGENEHGASVHFVTEQLDGGPVILQAKVPVFATDNEAELAARVHHQEHQIYPLVICWLVEGRLSLSVDDNAILDGKVLPIQGYATE